MKTPSSSDMWEWVLEKDDFDPDDETMDAEEEEIIARALQMNVEYDEAFRKGRVAVRITQLINDEYRTFWTFADGPAADRYDMVIGRAPGEPGFKAYVPQLSGCAAMGATQAEALANVRAAIDAWIETAVGEGRDIPVPSELAIAA